eukprot:scaffold50558_cov30-Tisochrysis_lutea.AAC.14
MAAIALALLAAPQLAVPAARWARGIRHRPVRAAAARPCIRDRSPSTCEETASIVNEVSFSSARAHRHALRTTRPHMSMPDATASPHASFLASRRSTSSPSAHGIRPSWRV